MGLFRTQVYRVGDHRFTMQQFDWVRESGAYNSRTRPANALESFRATPADSLSKPSAHTTVRLGTPASSIAARAALIRSIAKPFS